jgi:hypothetical protein
MSPGIARSLWEAIQRVDVRGVLPTIRVPTLVLHHADSPIPAAHGRLMAELIPGARYIELPGRDHLPGAGGPEAIAGEIEEFLTGTRGGGRPDRVLATVLFTDIVASTSRAAELGDSGWWSCASVTTRWCVAARALPRFGLGDSRVPEADEFMFRTPIRLPSPPLTHGHYRAVLSRSVGKIGWL